MERDDLELWLCGPDVPLVAPNEVAAALGLPVDQVADTTLLRSAPRVRALRLTLAVLRDVFVHDDDVADWLETEHESLDHVTPVDAILAGREPEVVELAVSIWNEMACAATPA
jgi:hypothetical protein